MIIPLLFFIFSLRAIEENCPQFSVDGEFKIKPEFNFNNSHDTLQLSWLGKVHKTLFAISTSNQDLPSEIFRSTDSGKSFQFLNKNFDSLLMVDKNFGLLKNSGDFIYLVGKSTVNPSRMFLYMSNDLGNSWLKKPLDFHTEGNFFFNPRLPMVIMFKSSKFNDVYLTTDNGDNWVKILENVSEIFWSRYSYDDASHIYYTKLISKKNYELYKYDFKTLDDDKILENVVKIWAPKGTSTAAGKKEEPDMFSSNIFLYALTITGHLGDKYELKVASDRNAIFKRAFLPRILKDSIFDIIEVNNFCAFLHMDQNEDAGYGTLYRSDATGRVFTPSLTYHFYNRPEKVHDFQKIDSFRGTYLASKFIFDHKLVTVITHDRGLTWQTLDNVENVNMTESCTNGEEFDEQPMGHSEYVQLDASDTDILIDGQVIHEPKETMVDVNLNITDSETVDKNTKCTLQISNKFSLKSATVAFPPVSLKTAPGLIIAHGHVADHLLTSKTSVFISQDGGATWNKTLDGPHSCHIINRGGIIIAVPIIDNSWPKELKYSFDKGKCWHTIPIDCSDCGLVSSGLNTEKIRFTGIVTAPDGSDMIAAIYGYGYYSAKWIVGVIDFEKVYELRRNCTVEDFEDWHLEKNQCHLGVKASYKVVKQGSICRNNGSVNFYNEIDICPCKETDFECDFGFMRNPENGELCIRNPNVPAVDTQVESAGFVEDLRRLGYQKHPGNKCQGGWKPNFSDQRFLHKALINKNYLIFFTTWGILVFLLLIILLIRFRNEKKKIKLSKYSRFTEPSKTPQEALKRIFTMIKPNNRGQKPSDSEGTTIQGNEIHSDRVTFNSKTDGFDNPNSFI